MRSRTVKRIIYLAVLIASGVLVSNIGGAFSYAFFFAVLLYPVAAVLQIIYTRIALRVYQEVDGRLLYKATPVTYQIMIENNWFIPISGVRLSYDKEVSGFEDDYTSREFSLAPRGLESVSTRLTCRLAGNFEAGITRIHLQDCFGIITFDYDIPTPLRVSVLPVITDIAVNDISRLNTLQQSGKARFRMEREEESLGDETRRYIEGDRLSTVHWKNYARSGELRIRLPEKQNSEMMSIACITDDTSKDIKIRDFMLEYIVSIANWFAEQKKPVRFVYYNAGPRECLVDDYESFKEFYLSVLPEIGRGMKDEEAAEVKDELLMETMKSHGVYFAFSEADGELARLG